MRFAFENIARVACGVSCAAGLFACAGQSGPGAIVIESTRDAGSTVGRDTTDAVAASPSVDSGQPESPSSDGSTGSDAGPPSEASADADGEAADAADGESSDAATAITSASCDYVVNDAPPIVATVGSGSMPVYTNGGTIADGTYWLTRIVLYAVPTPGPLTYQETVEVFGTSWNNALSYDGISRRATEILTVQGASGTLMYTCDSLNDAVLLQTTVNFTFDADGGTLSMADETDGYALTYERKTP